MDAQADLIFPLVDMSSCTFHCAGLKYDVTYVNTGRSCNHITSKYGIYMSIHVHALCHVLATLSSIFFTLNDMWKYYNLCGKEKNL